MRAVPFLTRRPPTATLSIAVCLGVVMSACGCGVFVSKSARLQAAGREGDTAAVESLVAQGAATGARDEDGTTSLHLAVRHADARMVKLLLAHGADADAADVAGRTPLHLAADATRRAVHYEDQVVREAQFESADICDSLLRAGADPNAVGPVGATPLHLAARRGAAGVVKLLLAGGADPARRDANGRTPLHWAVEPREEVILTDPSRPPLHERQQRAAEPARGRSRGPGARAPAAPQRTAAPGPGRFESVRAGLQEEEREFAEYVAANGGHPAAAVRLQKTFGRDGADAVRALAAQGADVGQAIFVLQQMEGRHEREVAELLIAIGAPVDARDDEGATPLQGAVRPDSVRVQRMAAEAGSAAPETQPLVLSGALARERRETARFLVAKGADANVGGAEGEAALSP